MEENFCNDLMGNFIDHALLYLTTEIMKIGSTNIPGRNNIWALKAAVHVEYVSDE